MSMTANPVPTTTAPARRDRVSEHTERRTFTETKLGVKTSEFYFAIVAIAGILVATYADGDDSLVLDDGWRMATFVAVAYIISRGLAKLGTREPYTEDRD
jgi:hypothetical protein